MPDPIPTDDLYARLDVPVDADRVTIERAWRAQLKRHHPDIAGATSLEIAKRINVAHDWLSQPELRSRYDEARAARAMRSGTARAPAARRRRAPSSPYRTPEPPRPAGPDELDGVFGLVAPAVRSLLAQAAALTRDDMDRLSVSDPQAFPTALRRLVPTELWRRVALLDERLTGLLGEPAWEDPRLGGSARGIARVVILEPFLLHQLDDAEELLEQLRRGWESAVNQPRYGPNTRGVRLLIDRFRSATLEEARVLAAGWAALGGDDEPWPAQAWPDDYTALRVSAALARRDGAAAPRLTGLEPAEEATLRAAFARMAHVAALRPIFPVRAYAPYQRIWDAVVRPWRGMAAETQAPTVRRA